MVCKVYLACEPQHGGGGTPADCCDNSHCCDTIAQIALSSRPWGTSINCPIAVDIFPKRWLSKSMIVDVAVSLFSSINFVLSPPGRTP